MADVNRGDRPLSPHLSIYAPQITWISSIFIRITGNALIVAAVMIVWWFAALAAGPEAFATATWWLTMPLGDLILGLSVWPLWYHTLGGARHLLWDTGRGMEIETAEKLGWACFVGATVLTLLTWLVFLFV